MTRRGLLTPGKLILPLRGPTPLGKIILLHILRTHSPRVPSDVPTICHVVVVGVMVRTIFEGICPTFTSRTSPLASVLAGAYCLALVCCVLFPEVTFLEANVGTTFRVAVTRACPELETISLPS